MEFWGIEVKPKEWVKCEVGIDKYIHLSMASLGEFRKEKESEKIPIFVKINDQKLAIGIISPENCTHIQYDLVFEKEFELSHGSKDTNVFFTGYKSIQQDDDSEDGLYDSDSDEDLQIDEKLIGKAVMKREQGKPTAEKVATGKDTVAAAKAKPQTVKPGSKAEKVKSVGAPQLDEDEDDDDDDSDEDEEMLKAGSDDDSDDPDDDDDDSSEDEEANLKAENDKKRVADGALKTPAGKKAKVSSPVEQKKSDAKKAGKITTPPAAKQAGKTPAGGKSNQQTPKSTGAFKCNSCNKSFNSENGLQAHSKAKHSAK